MYALYIDDSCRESFCIPFKAFGDAVKELEVALNYYLQQGFAPTPPSICIGQKCILLKKVLEGWFNVFVYMYIKTIEETELVDCSNTVPWHK